MPIGHLVDLMWRYKAGLVYLGASLIAASLLIMIGLIGSPDAMRAVMPIEAWFVLSVLLSPVGYVMQDAVADAMTVEAVPRLDARGEPIPADTIRLMHTTMQMLGRVAIIGGTVLVSLANVAMFQGSENLPEADKVAIYLRIYELALIIPLLSVSGVLLGGLLKRREARRLAALGRSRAEIDRLLHDPEEKTAPNWWILGGSAVFVALTIGIGLSGFQYGAGGHLRHLVRDHRLHDQPPAARALARGRAHPARHGDHHLRLPRPARPRRRCRAGG